MNYAFILYREVELPPQIGRNIDTSLTNLGIVVSPNLKTLNTEVPHVGKNVEYKFKRNVKRKLLNRRKRPPTHTWA